MKERFDVSSDHYSIHLTISKTVSKKLTPPHLMSKKNDGKNLKHILNRSNDFIDIQIENIEQLEDKVIKFTELIQNACWNSAPLRKMVFC